MSSQLHRIRFRLVGGQALIADILQVDIAAEWHADRYMTLVPRAGDMVKIGPKADYRKVSQVMMTAGTDLELLVFMEEDESDYSNEYLVAEGWVMDTAIGTVALADPMFCISSHCQPTSDDIAPAYLAGTELHLVDGEPACPVCGCRLSAVPF